jgi:lipopolysaccharide heptosyltransferase II
MSESGWHHAKNILCIRLDSLGDVLMMTPAIRALKYSASQRHITLLSSTCGASVAPFIPEIDDTITYAAPWMKSSSAHTPETDSTMIRALQTRHFDGAVIFTTYSQSPLPAAMLCYMAEIPLRLAHCRENPYHLLTDWVRETEPAEEIRHEVRRQLDLVKTIDCHTADESLSMHVRDDDIAWIRRLLGEIGIDPAKPWIILHPGASAASRRYPPPLWTEVARQLAQTTTCPLVFTGSEDESVLVEQIRQGLPESHTLTGKLDLGRLAALISLAPLIISNNTGPAHIAAAVGTPIVDLYALTNPQHTPWHVASRILFHDVPCRFCYKSICPEEHHGCLAKVEPQSVVEAATELLQTMSGDYQEPSPSPVNIFATSSLQDKASAPYSIVRS